MDIKSELKLSALQLNSVTGNVQANIEKVKKLVTENLERDTDILVLPEVWTVGWACDEFAKSAQNLKESSVISFLSELAKKYHMYIIGGSFIRKSDDGKLYNSCPVFDREGKLIAIYDKNHLYSYCGCTEGSVITPGSSGIIVDIDGIKTGLSICYDIRFPELYRAYTKAGADILVDCAAWGSKKPIPWEMMTKSRAIENQCYMLALTQSGYIENGEYNLGQSRIIDYKGDEVASIMDGEGLISADISIDEMYDFRKKAPILNDIKNKYEVKILCEKY